MNFRNTWFWICVAAALFGFIYFFQAPHRHPVSGPVRVLPWLRADTVTAIQVLPNSQLEIRAERTNNTWRLTQPLPYAAQTVSISNLLAALELLTPATFIPERELTNRFNADEEYGFATPQASIVIQQPEGRTHLRVGRKTPPGDQVFLQIVGREGIYVVDADLLKTIPRSANDWRDTTLVDLKGLAFDGLAVTNNAKSFSLERTKNGLWRVVHPIPARAYTGKIQEALELLQTARIDQFVSDDPKAELEALGLQPAELAIAFHQGTRTVTELQFGKTLTNDNRLCYARRLGGNAIFTVPKDLLSPWRAPVNDFRDPHLAAIAEPVQSIEVRGPESFSLVWQGSNTWQLLPEKLPALPADPVLVEDLLKGLGGLQISDFIKDVVTTLDWPGYGLAPPARRYILRGAPSAAQSNAVIAELNFGLTNDARRVYARCGDESSVYAVDLAELQRLPAISWQLRERRVWHFGVNDIAGATIRQQGRTRQIKRNGPHQWSLTLGSQGVIDDLAVEETVRGLAQASAAAWVAVGQAERARYGFMDNGHQVALELKNGQKASMEFGGEAPSGCRYAAVTLEGELWILEFPWPLYRDVAAYLSVPTNP